MFIGYFTIRDNVQNYRLTEIKTVMASIKIKTKYEPIDQGIYISNWRTGLGLIRKNPTEVALYVKTTQYLEDDKDYESAATLIELGLDFMEYEEIPIVLCEKLQNYYRHLPNRPKLDKDCRKIHDL